MTCWPFSRAKSPVCWATTLRPGALALISSTKPLVRSVVTLLPDEPSRIATLALPPVALTIAFGGALALLDEVRADEGHLVLAEAGVELAVDGDDRDLLGWPPR